VDLLPFSYGDYENYTSFLPNLQLSQVLYILSETGPGALEAEMSGLAVRAVKANLEMATQRYAHVSKLACARFVARRMTWRSRERRFHALYDRMFRSDVLRQAWEEVRCNGRSAGQLPSP
jgi:hypothetical protein